MWSMKVYTCCVSSVGDLVTIKKGVQRNMNNKRMEMFKMREIIRREIEMK